MDATDATGNATEITRSEIIRRTEEANLSYESMRAFVDTLRELPNSQRGQLNALNAYIETTEAAAKRSVKANESLWDQLGACVLEALERLVEQHAQSADAAEDILQTEMNEWYRGLLGGFVRRIAVLTGSSRISRMADGHAAQVMGNVAGYSTAALLNEKPMPEPDESLPEALSRWAHEPPPTLVFEHTVLASITWRQLREEALRNGADGLIGDIHANTEKAERLIRRKHMAEMVEGRVLQQSICFRDDTATAGEDALPSIPESAEPFSGKKYGRYDRCQQLLNAWGEHGNRIETKNHLHREAGSGVRKAVERALKDVGWSVPTDVLLYVTAVQKLIDWHDERT